MRALIFGATPDTATKSRNVQTPRVELAPLALIIVSSPHNITILKQLLMLARAGVEKIRFSLQILYIKVY